MRDRGCGAGLTALAVAGGVLAFSGIAAATEVPLRSAVNSPAAMPGPAEVSPLPPAADVAAGGRPPEDDDEFAAPLVEKADLPLAMPVGQDGAFHLVFRDEFDGETLDLSRWTTCYWWDDNGCTNLGNNEMQWYRPENVSLADGNLVIEARPEEVVGWKGRMFPYTSGIVTTGLYYEEDPSQVRFATTYGYFEIRAKVPAGQGLWSAFWTLPVTRESKPEIDVMEVLGHRADVLEMHFHYRNDKGDSRSVGHEVETVDLASDWQVYGLEWSEEAIVWYLNGEEVWRYEEKERIPSEPLYLLLNLAVGGDWPGAPDETTVFPAHYVIDYVRVWQRGEE